MIIKKISIVNKASKLGTYFVLSYDFFREEPLYSIVNQKDFQISVTEKKRAISSMNPPLHSIVELLSKQL